MRAAHSLVLALALAVSGLVLVPGTAATASPSGSAAVGAALTPKLDVVIPGEPSTYRKVAPGSYTPTGGAKFNNPYGDQSSRRRLLSHVIRAINSSPGYQLPVNPATGKRVACPTNPADYPSEIKIALYSIADRAFVDALIAAHRRCVSVKLLMNSHLNADNSPSWRRLVNGVGTRSGNYNAKRSFAYRCSNGCIGSSVLHTKMFLFTQAGSARNTVMVGSSNMTSNAVRVQWNDLFTVNGNADLHGDYRAMFNKMVPDRAGNGPRIYQSGPYTSTFYPFRHATRNTDKTMNALRTIRCTGATGGAGYRGRTVVHIVMHAWHGTRGRYLAERVRQMYNNGCYIKILYSFMGRGTYSYLTRNTGSRMVARRVLFAGPRGVVAAKYSHMKMFSASGYVSGDSSNWVTWTGSNNWSDRGLRADEVTIRIPSRATYNQYVSHWNFMRNRRSSGTWAIYEEPGGGGRLPD